MPGKKFIEFSLNNFRNRMLTFLWLQQVHLLRMSDIIFLHGPICLRNLHISQKLCNLFCDIFLYKSVLAGETGGKQTLLIERERGRWPAQDEADSQQKSLQSHSPSHYCIGQPIKCKSNIYQQFYVLLFSEQDIFGYNNYMS